VGLRPPDRGVVTHSWPVTTAKDDEDVLWVRGIPARTGITIAAVTPGTTPHGMPADTSIVATATEDEWSPPFRRTTAEPRRRAGLHYLAAPIAGTSRKSPMRPRTCTCLDALRDDDVGAGRHGSPRLLGAAHLNRHDGLRRRNGNARRRAWGHPRRARRRVPASPTQTQR
jgi:hypothetical protein